jgi:PAS domain S-box-containing protein
MFSTRSRIALGITCTVVSVVLIAMNVGILPDYRRVAQQGRVQLGEAIAANSSVIVRQRDVQRMRSILQLVVQRNGDIVSAAVRRADGSLAVEIGDHAKLWQAVAAGAIVPTQISVPIQADNQVWGSVELTFKPFEPAGWWGYVVNRQLLYVAFVGTVTFLLSSYYLRKTLQHVDPSKVVPGRVRSALDTLAEGLLVLDDKYRIMLANQSLADIVGELPERLIGRCVTELPWAVKGNAEQLEYPWETAMRDEAPLTGLMMRLDDCEGKRRSFMVNCTPISGNDGKVRGVLASLEDVTQLEETQHELSRSKEAADAANRAKSDFLARMSHEIRTPMNAILGFTDMLRRGFEANELERQEYLDTIHASGEHLLNLINDILDLSKVEAGRLDIEKIQCSPLQLIYEAVTVLRGQAEKKGISLGYEAPEGLPEYVITDPVRFRQLLTNLIGNAIKFTEQGGVRVVARTSTRQRRPQLIVEIIDTGIGIPDETLERIFDPFVQADTSITRRFGGTGLGLAISRRFVEALGGDLTVRSEMGKGSVFTFTIDTGPLDGVRTVTLDQATHQLRRTRASHSLRGQLPAVRILVVDDGESNRKLISLVLSRAGAVIQCARHGKEAIEAVGRICFDLVLMDIQMPVMDGYTATRILRERGLTMPIIALTADAMKGTEEKCREAGCSGFLTKPIDMDQLVHSLAETLRDHGYAFAGGESLAPDATSAPHAGRVSIHSTLPTDDLDFCQIIAEFHTRVQQQLVAMHAALSAGNYRELSFLAHWLKGSGGTAGFHEFTAPAKALEKLVRAAAPDEALADVLTEIEQIVDGMVVPPLPMAPIPD